MSVNRFPIITKGALMVILGSTLLMTVPHAGAQDLGKISTCPSAPQISAAATAFALSNDSGLSVGQSSVLLTTVLRQITQSAPYLASESTLAAMNSLRQAVLTSAQKGEVVRNDLDPEKVSTLSIEQAITTSDGYRKMTKAVIQGGIDGAMSMGLGAEGLQKLITAVTVSLVADAAVQASTSAINNPNKDPSKALPMDTDQKACALMKVLIKEIVSVAYRAGFTKMEISLAVKRAGDVCVEKAKNMDNIIQKSETIGVNEAEDSAARQVAQKVARIAAARAAKTIADEVMNHVDVMPEFSDTDAEAVTDPLTTPGAGNRDTLPTAPGQQIIPGVNAPPQNLTPLPTPTPTPVPTPTPASRF